MKNLEIGQYIDSLVSTIYKIDESKIFKILELILETRTKEKSIFIAGNGGSAATASHLATDLSFNSGIVNPKLKVISLNENISTLTATGNDLGFEQIYSRQLENYASKGDLLILISASGNSKNLLNCLDVCRTKNIYVIGLTGFNGGLLSQKVDLSLHFPTEIGMYGVVEDTHMIVGHILTQLLKNGFKKYN